MREFKYKTSFVSRAKVVVPSERDKYLSLASLDKLKDILPAGVNIDENPDLLLVAGNAAVAGLVNLNDDAISKETGLAIAANFKYKFIDIEHERSQIVGCLLNYGFTEYGTDKVMTLEEAQASDVPVNIAIGGIVWPIIEPDLSKLLVDSNDENSANFGKISFSWEIGFDDYDIVVGDKEVSKAHILSKAIAKEEYEKYEKTLRSLGGTGVTEDGRQVYRLIKGNALPLGVGLVTSPAASVKGVLVANAAKEAEVEIAAKLCPEVDNQDIKEGIEAAKNAFSKETLEIAARSKEKQKIVSQKETTTVKNNSIMKITKLEDINDETFSELSAAAVKNFVGHHIADKIDEASSAYAEQLDAKEQELKNRQAEAEKIQAQFDETLAKVEELKAQLQQEQEARATEKVQADFTARMAQLDSEYELGEKELEVIAKRIRGLDDSSFAGWLEEFSLFAGAKKKKAQSADKEDDEDDKKKEAKASIEAALEETEEEKQKALLNTPSTEKSVREQFAEAFTLEDFKISR